MGTGIVAILLHNLPYNGVWLYWLSVVIFALNVLLFVLFTVLSALRYTMYPEVWGALMRHPVQSLFLGTFPMGRILRLCQSDGNQLTFTGLATLVNLFVYICVPSWGPRAVPVAWTFWWIDTAIAVAICFYLPFVM